MQPETGVDRVATAAVALMLVAMLMSTVNPPLQFGVRFHDVKWGFFIGLFLLACLSGPVVACAGPLPRLFFCFTCVLTVSTVTGGGNGTQGLQRIASYWILYALSFHCFLPVVPYERLRTWTLALFGTCTAVLVLSVLVFVISPGMASLAGRYRGICYNPNTLGVLSAVVISGAAGLYASRAAHSRLLLGLAVLGGLSLAASQSRAAILGAVAGLTVVLWSRGRRTLGTIVALAFLFALYGAAHGAPQLPTPFAAERSAPFRRFSADTRLEIWQSQWEAFVERPLIGHGMEVGDSSGRPVGDSSYLDIMASVGLIGSLPLFLGICIGLRQLFLSARGGAANLPGIGLRRAALGMVVVVLASSLAEGFLAGVGNAYAPVLWVVMGAMAQESGRELAARDAPGGPVAVSRIGEVP